jgi:hypothetical protein
MAKGQNYQSRRGASNRALARLYRTRVVSAGFLLLICLLLYSQYSVMRVSMKKYLKKLEKAKAFVKICAGDESKLSKLSFDGYAGEGRPERVVSKGTVMGTTSGSGNMVKQFYKLENVQMGKDGLNFFYGDDFQKPEENFVDTIFNNGTNMHLPTTTMMRHAENGKYSYIKWHYNPASKKQPSCRKWVDRPTYLVQMQHSTNIWHVWNEGIQAAFQTLREQGLLPLVEVDERGYGREYVDDLDLEGCTWIIDQDTLAPRRLASCRMKTGQIPDGPCTTGILKDCSPGVHSYFREDGPVLWLAKGMGVTKTWQHMFKAISSNIWSWESLQGSCFRELYIGKSNTLSYYMPLMQLANDDSQTELTKTNIRGITAWRSNSTEAFKRVMRPSQKNALVFKRDVSKIPMWKEPWPDHTRTEWSRLFEGVGPERIDALDTVRPNKSWARRAYMSPKEVGNLEKMWNRSSELTQNLATRSTESKSEATPAQGGAPHEKPRPVVTYLWRDNYKRSVLNTHDVLSYILLRYNVTLRVTSLQEPLPEIVRLMSSSDVVIGMHGAGWTNGLFLKRGATSLQLIPYGWVKSDGSIIRGSSYKSLLLASDSKYHEYVNEDPQLAFLRRHDFKSMKLKGQEMEYTLHPKRSWVADGVRPGNHWIYQNTYVDMAKFHKVLDETMHSAGITPMIK